MSFKKKKQLYVEEAVKQAIYAAAVKVLGESGLEGLTIQNVAKEAGIATGTVYNYFKGKKELLIYIHQGLTDLFLAEIEKHRQVDATAVDRLKIIIDSVFGFAFENMRLFIMMHQAKVIGDIGGPEHMEMIQKNRARFIGIISCIIEDGIKEGVFRQVPVQKAANLLDSCIAGVIATGFKFDRFDLKEDPKSVYELFMSYLTKK